MVKVYSIQGEAVKEIKLPKFFSYEFRPDLIQRAFLAAMANSRQPYGTDPLAGHRTSAHYHGVKHTRYTMKNRSIARGPRSHGTSPAQEFRMRFVPQSRGGRAAHPPKAQKVLAQKINRKEARAALLSAVAATANEQLARARGHKFELELPIVVEDKVQELKKASEVRALLQKLKLQAELARAARKKIKAGKGKARARKYKRKKSVLFIIESGPIARAARNIQGVDVMRADSLNITQLAPGGHAGRLTIWSESALKKVGELYG